MNEMTATEPRSDSGRATSSGSTFDELIKDFFSEDVMKEISSSHYKHRDGVLTIEYEWWGKEWTIYHFGYWRDEIRGRGHTLESAVIDFRKEWEDWKAGWGKEE